MELQSRHAESLSDAIVDLETAAKVPAKSRPIRLSEIVSKVCSEAYEDGLTDASLNALVDLITLPNQLDQGSIGNLIKSLFPASRVPDAIVIKVVGSLGHGQTKSSFTTQAALLKWLVMVYDILENQQILSRLYGVLFNFLETVAIRSQLCHLLSLITRRKHVRPFRIQVLMELTRQAGNDPALIGLMRVYKEYYPDVIVGDVTSGRALTFMHPNSEWRQRLGEIQVANFQRTQDGLTRRHHTFSVVRKYQNRRKGTNSSLIPEVHTSHAQESSTTLEEIENINDFIRRLEKIELPNQLIAVIGDPLLQKFLQLKSSDITVKRVNHWLLDFFEEQLESPGSSEAVILQMLEAIRDFTRYELPPACVEYFKFMLDSWNGVTGREVILDLLIYTPPNLYPTIFQPLEEALLVDSSVESQLDLLTFYANLLRHWTALLISDIERSGANGQSIGELINHTNVLALTILQISSSVSTCAKVLNFYESTASLFSEPALRETVRITIPPAELVYTLYFTHSLSTTSRLCYILALYKRAFESAMAPKSNTGHEQLSYPKEYVNHFNGFLMDICNCIWRSRAFNTSDINAIGCLLKSSVVALLGNYVSRIDSSISLPSLFSLSFSPLLSLQAISYVRELEDKDEDVDIRHAGPVTQASLKQLEMDGGLKISWPDYRLGVLRYLEQKGILGVGELMYNTMKHLMTAREKMF